MTFPILNNSKSGLVKCFKLWLPVAFWAAVIFCLSATPDLKTGFKYDFILRKIAHIAEYFILTFLLYRAFKGAFVMHTVYLFVYPLLLSFLYAVSDEIHQAFVPGRHCSFYDLLIDAIGIFGFYLAVKIYASHQAAKQTASPSFLSRF